MKDFTVKKAVLSVVSALAALMMLIALCVPLTKTTLNGFGFSDCGFQLLDFSGEFISKDYQWGAIVLGLLSYLHLFGALALFALDLAALFCFKRKTSWLLAIISVGVAIGASLLYMIEGIVYTAICIATYGGLPFTTLAFLPLIFCILIGVAFLICNFMIKEPKTAEETALSGEKMRLWEIPEREGVARISPERADLLAMNFKKFIPEESLMHFREALTRVGEDRYSVISMTPVKDPTTMLLFSVFLGGLGVDRFYLGDTGLGVAKLFTGALTFGIWPIVDIFLCYKKVKEQNLEALLRNMRV